MLLKILRANHFYNFVLSAAVGILWLLGSIIEGGIFPSASCVNTTPLCLPLMNSGITYIGAIFINYLTVVIISFLLLQINAKFDFVKERTFLPVFLFIFIVYALPDLRVIQPIFIAAILYLMAVRSIFGAFEKRDAIRSSFDSSFFIGLAGIFYIPATIFIILVPISIFLLRNKIKWRDIIIPFVGVILPWIFLFSYYYITNNSSTLIELISNSFVRKERLFLHNTYIQIYLSYIVLLIACSSYFILHQYGLKNIDVRRYFKILFLFFICSSVMLLFPFVSSEILVFITLPLTFLITNYFIFLKRRFWAEFFLLILVILSITLQFFI
jgi:hypothetical protein